MLKKDVKIGGHYAIKHTSSKTGRLSVIRIDRECQYGGWYATNLKTGRTIRIKAATKLRFEVVRNPLGPTPKWVTAERAKELEANDPATNYGAW